MKYKVKDIGLAKQGLLKIEWAEKEMPVLRSVAEVFSKTKPFKGVTIAACLHVTKETAVLAKALTEGGAKVVLCGSNPLSTQDDVAAGLAKLGISVFAWKGINRKDYYWALNQVLEQKPNITIDDGADLISLIHSERQDLLKTIWAGQEETTTGVIRLKAMAKEGRLKYPVVAINDTPTKHLFDNHYGTGQSTIDSLLRSTNILMAGKQVVIVGYGHCGSGIAATAAGYGAQVTVTEVDPVKGLQALMDGYRVMPMKEAARFGDVFLTATGDKHVITVAHMELMKDGAILGNSGHFNVEIDVEGLKKAAKSHKAINKDVEEYQLGRKKVYLIAEGRLMNLAAAEGHPSAVMDMSFADQALTCAWIVKNHKGMEAGVHNVPEEIDVKVASFKLAAMGTKIDELTPEQKHYLESWNEGT